MAQKAPEDKSYLRYGVATGVLLAAAFVIYNLFGLLTNRTLALLPAILYVVLIIAAQINHARKMKEGITYGDLFAVGFKTAAAATAIYLVFLILFVLFIPSFKSTLVSGSRGTVGLIGLTLVMNLIRGVIAALIGALIARKKPQS